MNTAKDKDDEKDARQLRGYLSRPAQELIQNKTIAEVRVAELQNLMPQCHIVLIESDDQKSIEFKLVFR